MEGIRKATNERNLKEGQWEDRKQWSLGVGQRRKNVLKPIYIVLFLYMFRATMCPSSGEITVPMRHLVFFTLNRLKTPGFS
jgi:hypothetical protein